MSLGMCAISLSVQVREQPRESVLLSVGALESELISQAGSKYLYQGSYLTSYSCRFHLKVKIR